MTRHGMLSSINTSFVLCMCTMQNLGILCMHECPATIAKMCNIHICSKQSILYTKSQNAMHCTSLDLYFKSDQPINNSYHPSHIIWSDFQKLTFSHEIELTKQDGVCSIMQSTEVMWQQCSILLLEISSLHNSYCFIYKRLDWTCNEVIMWQ